MSAAVSNSPPINNHVINDSPLDISNDSASCRNTYTHLTYSRHHLIDIANDTLKITKNGQYTNSNGDIVDIKQDSDASVENSVHYEHEFDFHYALKEYDNEKECVGPVCPVGKSSRRGSGRRGSGSLRRGSGSNLDSFDEENDTNNKDEGESSAADTSPSTSSQSMNDQFGSLCSSGTLKLSFSSLNKLTSGGRMNFPRTSFLVVSASWLESALELLGASSSSQIIRVGVLNSASGTTPGGRFLKGTVSQEDCLCRASLLYSCISQPKFQSEGRFYGKNRSLRYGTSNCVIFSPDVPVIREDSVEGKLLDKPAKVSFVTIPAPNAFTTSTNSGKEYNDIESDERHKRMGSNSRNNSCVDLHDLGAEEDFDEKFEQKRKALLDSLSDRIHRALSAFVLGNCTDLVLPAFGCGVHGNDPSMVASVFREMLTDPNQFGGRFRTVVFAIPPSRKQNYQAFASYFQKKETVQRVTMTKDDETGRTSCRF